MTQHIARLTRDPTRNPASDSVVYLLQEPSVPKHTGRILDITPLMWWGKVRALMERNQTASMRPGASMVQIRHRLSGFRPDRDYMAFAGGDALAAFLAGAALRELGHDYFYYLRFERTRLPDGTRDPSSGAYVPVYAPLTESAARAL